MRTLLALLLCVAALYAEHKAVIDVTTGDLERFEQKVIKGSTAFKNYFEGNFKEIDIVVVIHGDAYKFFYKKNKKPLLSQRIRSLATTYDITFLMCEAGMKKLHLKKSDVLDVVAFIPNAGIGLITKQNSGYAYIPVH